jgi:hypothetical protein
MVMALVYDIRNVSCTLPAQLFVDTNAWLDMHYPPFSFPQAGRRSAIPHNDFIGRCLAANVSVLRSAFCLPEMAHVIEKDVVDEYCTRTGQRVSRKQSRTMINLRRKVVASFIAAWRGVEQTSTASEGLLADDALAVSALARYGKERLDGYDLFLVEEVMKCGEKAILTDDPDYLSVGGGLKMFTANASAIAAASDAGRLRV